jgi:putative effector of murein hydrolase
MHALIITGVTMGGFIALTIAAYAGGKALNRRTGRHPAANATLIAIAVVIAALLCLRQHYTTYMHGAALIAWLLAPATVALGIPLARNLGAIRRDALPVILAVLAGALVAAISAPLLLRGFGGSASLVLSMAPKAVTTPIAMAIATRIGGVPALAAIFAIIGGVIVAVLAKPVLDLLGIEDHRNFGLSAGVAGSGIAAAQAVERHEQAGAYAALAVGLNSIATAIIVPVLIALHWL